MKGRCLALAALAAALFVCSLTGALAQQQECCLYATGGAAHPADHNWQYDPADPDAPNLMMHAKICMRCNPGVSGQALVTGVRLTANGTGNDATDINWIRVSYDVDCNGTPDLLLGQTAGGYPVDNGVVQICNPNAAAMVPPVDLTRCICLVIEYNLKPTAPCGATYGFTLTSILAGTACQTYPQCTNPGPLASAIKTVVCDQPCCLIAMPGPHMPADHTFNCAAGQQAEPNFMMDLRICNPCPTPQPIYGLVLQPQGTGNPSSIQSVIVRLDANCDGVPDTTSPPLTGTVGPDGLVRLCSTTGVPLVVLGPPGTPNNCACILIYYQMNCPPAPGTYYFNVTQVLGAGCEPICVEGLPLQSAVKTVPQNCCLEVSLGPKNPADHVWKCTTPIEPNFMQHLRICNPCSVPISFHGVQLQAFGSGNDATGISAIKVGVDKDCDGVVDGGTLTGTYTADDGVANICSSAGATYTLQPGECICLKIAYVMKCDAPPGTYGFTTTAILGPNCQPICANVLPLKSATKTIEDCCLEVSKGPGFPPDHTFHCVPGTNVEPNLMAIFRVCNPCPTTQCISGLVLKAGGTGNDLTGIAGVRISIDHDCDGKPEQVGVFQGAYSSDNGTLTLCNTAAAGAALCLPPGRCVCIRVEYLMKCDAPAGTYYFDLISLLGSNCQPICAKVLPIRSAVKTVVQACCLDVVPGPKMPTDHTYTCPATGGSTLNHMMQVQICNPCPFPVQVYGVNMQAYGSGNDATGISAITMSVDTDCDGVPDTTQPPSPTGTYAVDNGTATLCNPTMPYVTLQPYQCICINIYYKMKCPNPVPGTYLFALTDILGPNCQPLCVFPGLLPIKSAVKTIEPNPCCLEVLSGPSNPPSHYWIPGLPKRNRMFQFQICNPCPETALIRCLTLQATGSGNDQTDILAVRLIQDLNCDGVAQIGEPVVGTSAYPADNGSITFVPNTPILLAPHECKCFLVEYLMSGKGKWGSTYCMVLTNVCATKAATNQDFCLKGLPLRSNCKKICWKVGHLKLAQPGWVLCLPWKVITAVFPDRFYIQDLYGDSGSRPDDTGPMPDRSSGVAVRGAPPSGCHVGSVVDVEGTLELDGCELIVQPGSVTPNGPPSFFDIDWGIPGFNNRNTGGGAMGMQSAMVDSFFDVFTEVTFSQQTNNVGLLERTWGRITSVGPDHVYVNDGSGLKDGTLASDGTPNIGIRVQGVDPRFQPGQIVQVTGIMSTMPVGHGLCARLLRPRTDADIKILVP